VDINTIMVFSKLLAHIYKMKRVLLVLLLPLVCSCSAGNNWQEFKADGLPTQDEEYEDLLFVNDTLGYLGGSKLTLVGNKQDFKNEAILYKTKNKGKTWQQVPLNYEGSIEKIFAFKDSLILLLQDVTIETNYILKSTDGGKSWKEIFSYSKGSLIRDIHFDTSVSGKIIFDSKEGQYILGYNEIQWDTISILPNNYFHHRIFNNKVVSLIPEGLSANSIGISVTVPHNKNNKFNFDKPYYIASSSKVGNDLLLAAQVNEKGKIIKFSNNKIEYIDFGDFAEYKPDNIFSSGKTIIAIVSRDKDAAFLGVIHAALVSNDNGKTWDLEELPNPLAYKPAFLFQDNFFISNALVGQFQARQ